MKLVLMFGAAKDGGKKTDAFTESCCNKDVNFKRVNHSNDVTIAATNMPSLCLVTN